MYSFLGLGRHFRDVLRVGSKSRRPVRVFPSNFLGGGGKFLFLHFGCAISPTTFTTHFTLREHVAISSKSQI